MKPRHAAGGAEIYLGRSDASAWDGLTRVGLITTGAAAVSTQSRFATAGLGCAAPQHHYLPALLSIFVSTARLDSARYIRAPLEDDLCDIFVPCTSNQRLWKCCRRPRAPRSTATR